MLRLVRILTGCWCRVGVPDGEHIADRTPITTLKNTWMRRGVRLRSICDAIAPPRDEVL
jgi:hypothetical protein